MTFSDPRWLAALLALPILALLEGLAARRASTALARLAGTRVDSALLAQRRPRERIVGAAIRLVAFTLLVLGAASPEWGREVIRRGTTGSDIVLVLDVSASMDARDVSPSRIDESRREALAVLDRIAGSRVGIVAFAGDAVRLCPLTLDRSAARLLLESASTGTVSEPGSDLGKALSMALRVMPPGRREEQAIVLWTDGEDLAGGARTTIGDVARAGVRVLVVGVGTPVGDVVPVLDAEGRAIDVKRDENGRVVRSRLDEGLLHVLAGHSHGAYFSAQTPGGELPRLLSAVDGVARAGRSQRLVERSVARFPWFAAAAALLLLFDFTRAHRRRAAASLPTPSRPAAARAAAIVTVASLALASRAHAQSDWARGDQAFRAGRYAVAETLYARRLRRGGPDAVRVNRATAAALGGGDTSQVAELKRLSQDDRAAGRTAGYNLGTLLGQRRDYDPALEALRQVLERDPTDADARWNYEVLLRRRQSEQQSPPQPQPQPQPQPSPSAGQPPPQPGPQNPPPAPSPNQGQRPPPPPQGSNMTRAQAEQLLNALEELARAEQQRRRNVRAVQEKHGKDW
jgi:Ca-activated chloride channel family protein